MRTSSNPAVGAIVAPCDDASARSCHLAFRPLTPPVDRPQRVLVPAYKVGIVPAASGLVGCAVLVNTWRQFDWNVHGHTVGKLETNVMVAIADGTAGLVGLVLVPKASMETPVFSVRHIISM